MTRFRRVSDGASVDAEQYDGSSASANRIMDLIGTRGVNNTEAGLLTPIGYISRGSWVIKGRRGVMSSATDAVFKEKFSQCQGPG
jgi:hypothetical protein